MTIYRCDRCGEEVGTYRVTDNPFDGGIRGRKLCEMLQSIVHRQDKQLAELCEGCWDALQVWLKPAKSEVLMTARCGCVVEDSGSKHIAVLPCPTHRDSPDAIDAMSHLVDVLARSECPTSARPKAEKRAAMRMSIKLLHELLKLPANVVVRQVFMGHAGFREGMFTVCMTGDGLPTDVVGEGFTAPEVTAEYRKTKDGPEFMCFLVVPEAGPLPYPMPDAGGGG